MPHTLRDMVLVELTLWKIPYPSVVVSPQLVDDTRLHFHDTPVWSFIETDEAHRWQHFREYGTAGEKERNPGTGRVMVEKMSDAFVEVIEAHFVAGRFDNPGDVGDCATPL